jgi:hypothetical protein
MARPVPTSLVAHFRRLPDPRVRRTRRHALVDILVITLCAVICGTEDWVSIAHFGHPKRKWLRGFLTLRHGVSSHGTFCLVFAALDPEAFKAAFLARVHTVAELLPGEVIAVDGETLRRTFDTASTKAASHMVSAWATDDLARLPSRHRRAGLRSVVRIGSERTVASHATRESRCFIASLAPENLAILQPRALNLLKQERTAILSIKNKRLAAGWDHDCLLRVNMGANNHSAIALHNPAGRGSSLHAERQEVPPERANPGTRQCVEGSDEEAVVQGALPPAVKAGCNGKALRYNPHLPERLQHLTELAR